MRRGAGVWDMSGTYADTPASCLQVKRKEGKRKEPPDFLVIGWLLMCGLVHSFFGGPYLPFFHIMG